MGIPRGWLRVLGIPRADWSHCYPWWPWGCPSPSVSGSTGNAPGPWTPPFSQPGFGLGLSFSASSGGIFPTCPVGSCPWMLPLAPRVVHTGGSVPPGLVGACPCPLGWATSCPPTPHISLWLWVWERDLRAQQLSGVEYITFLSPPAHSISGQAAVSASLAGAGTSPLGSGHAPAEPFASQQQQKSFLFSWHPMREQGARSCCHHGWSHLTSGPPPQAPCWSSTNISTP